jgi:hypothetical protein
MASDAPGLQRGTHGLINRLRGLLGEFGVWRGRSTEVLTRALPELENDEALPMMVRRLLGEARPTSHGSIRRSPLAK